MSYICKHFCFIILFASCSFSILAADREDNEPLIEEETAEENKNTDNTSESSGYTKHPNYVFAEHFFKYLKRKLNVLEFDTSKPSDTAYKTFHYTKALEEWGNHTIAAESLTHWYSELNINHSIAPAVKKIIQERIIRILNREPLSQKQIRYLFIYFLDVHDKAFKALPPERKLSLSVRSLVLLMLEVCKTPATFRDKLSMVVLISNYPQEIGKTVLAELLISGGSYLASLPIAVATLLKGSSFSFAAALGYPVIGAFSALFIYNGVNWLWFNSDESAIQFTNDDESSAPIVITEGETDSDTDS